MADDKSVVQDVVEETPEILAEAKDYGWVPKDKFRGDPANWVSAAEHVKRGRNSIPILRSKLSKSEKELQTLRGKISTLESDMQTVRQVATEQAKAEWEAKYNALLAQKRQAIEDDDASAIVEVDEKIADHKGAKPTAKAPADDNTDPFAKLPPDQREWFEANAWYKDNPKLRARANTISLDLQAEGLKGVALYEAVKAELYTIYPDDMAEAEGTEPPTTSRPRHGTTHRSGTRANNRGGPQPGERSYDNLPDEAKAVCDRLVASKQLTKDEYVKHYKGEFK